MEKIKQFFKSLHKKHIEGYPKITETAPKFNVKPFKVNLNDPKFNKPYRPCR